MRGNTIGAAATVVRQMTSSQSPDERPLVRPLFALLVCAGYVYAAFFLFFMFRTIILPEYFAR